ncbi:replication protein RepA [Enterobacteriaceae bacterium ML5]|nr:replication protein RepA [Enterobacteriaceae bacterium ML5]
MAPIYLLLVAKLRKIVGVFAFQAPVTKPLNPFPATLRRGQP